MVAPTSLDIQIGNCIRNLRLKRGLTQEKLAHALDISFQQVQKYERGTNRVTVGRLYQIARIFAIPVSFFFYSIRFGDDACEDNVQLAASGIDGDPVLSIPSREGQTRSRESLCLLEAYYSIPDEIIRHQVFELICSLAEKRAAVGIKQGPDQTLL